VHARRGQGVEKVFDFLAGAMAKPSPRELPILQDVPKCRAWAGHVGSQASYRAPAPPKWTRRLDAVFLHPVGGPLLFLAVVIAIFQTIFTVAEPSQTAVDWVIGHIGNWIASALPAGLFKSLVIEDVYKRQSIA